jgi:hypothetical protein
MTSRGNRYPAGADDNDELGGVTCPVSSTKNYQTNATAPFTPTSGSWLNLVEVFFGIITRQAIRRGTFTSVKDLIAAIETFTDGWNDRCQPSSGPKTADEILTKTNRKKTSNTQH